MIPRPSRNLPLVTESIDMDPEDPFNIEEELEILGVGTKRSWEMIWRSQGELEGTKKRSQRKISRMLESSAPPSRRSKKPLVTVTTEFPTVIVEIENFHNDTDGIG